ncbi:MAG: hypothetical protein R6U15_05140 [Candidatus Izemoplasmatales bacterium]
MINSLLTIFIAITIIIILIFAYLKKSKLASLVAFTILGAYAISMAINGFVSLIADVDFLSFLETFFRFINDIIVFIEAGVIIFLLFFTKHKTKVMLLKVAIIVYVVLRLLVELNVF